MTLPTKKIISKIFQSLFNQNYTTFRIYWGFEQFSISIGWRVMVVQSVSKKWLKVRISRTLEPKVYSSLDPHERNST